MSPDVGQHNEHGGFQEISVASQEQLIDLLNEYSLVSRGDSVISKGGDTSALLFVNPPEAGLAGKAHGVVDLAGPDQPIEDGMAEGFGGRMALIHDVDRGVARNFIGEELHDLVRAGEATG